MTGITQVVPCVTEQGRFGLIALLALLPPALQAAAARLARLSRMELDAFHNPVGTMPMAKYEFFQEYGQGGPSSRASGRWGPAAHAMATAPTARPQTLPRVVAAPTAAQRIDPRAAASSGGKLLIER